MATLADRVLLSVAPWLAAKIISLLYRRLSPETIDNPAVRQLRDAGQPVILAFWHDQLLLMVKGYSGHGAKVLISSSRDGELISRTIAYFGVGAVRGSSNRGGSSAFKEMLSLTNEPLDLVMTPDGPKGPRHSLKDGIVHLARISGRPVVPTAFVCSHGHRFQSWDRFLLPFPWGKAIYIYGDPLVFAKDETVESFQSRVQQAMNETNRMVREHLNRYDLSAV